MRCVGPHPDDLALDETPTSPGVPVFVLVPTPLVVGLVGRRAAVVGLVRARRALVRRVRDWRRRRVPRQTTGQPRIRRADLQEMPCSKDLPLCERG